MLSLRIAIVAFVAGSITMLGTPPRAFAQPGNDLFVNAIAISVPYSNAGNELLTNGAMLEPDEPLCEVIDATVWYALTPTQSGPAKVSTEGSDFDTVLAVYSGTMLNNLQSLDCNDDSSGGTASTVQLDDAVGGTTYYIQAGGYLGATGNLRLTTFYGTPPANDDFADAEVVSQPLPNMPYTDGRDTIVASTELDEPEVPPEPYTCAPMGRTVWYSFTPAQRNLVLATTAGTEDFDTVLAVYTGTTLADLTSLGCSDDAGDLTSAVQFVAESGTTYHIQAGGYQGGSGNLVFNLGIDTSDPDGDGWSNESEILYIGTGADDPCGNDGWPADLTGDNTLNIADLNSFIFPLRINDGSFNKFNHPVPDPDDSSIERWNLEPNNSIGIGDINALNPAVQAPTSRPPMFGGQPAFFTNGGVCPSPP